MSDLDLEIEVDTKAIGQRLQQSIDEGVRDAAREITDEVVDVAESKIIRENAVWRKQLLNSFGSEIVYNQDGIWVRVFNYSDHAAPAEDGAEFPNKQPPVDALLPWVRSELKYFKISSGRLRATPDHAGFNIAHPEFPGYTKGEVDKAFWLARKIKRDGLAPVGFMLYARKYIAERGKGITADHIGSKLKKYNLK